MLCEYCHSNDRQINKHGKELKYCSKRCQSAHILEKRKVTNLQKYGVENPMKSAKVLEKRNNTNLEKYGVTNPFSLPEIQQQQQQTCLKKYGVKFASQSLEVQEKIKHAYKKYNNAHPFSDSEIRKKRAATLNSRYQVEHPILNPTIQQKIKQTNLLLYGTENAAKSPIIAQKISNSLLASQKNNQARYLKQHGVTHPNQLHLKPILKFLEDSVWLNSQVCEIGQVGVAQLLNVSVDTIRKYVKFHKIILPASGSDFERSVIQFIKSCYNGTVLVNSRKLIGKEIDIYLPDKNLAFECNGTYWHSDLNGRGRSYHLDKTIACNNNNVELLHIWEHAWNFQRDLIKSRIKSKLNLNSKIHARKCQIRELSATTARDFLKKNHIQGSCNSAIELGLYDCNDLLVAVMTFGKSRFNKKYEYELLRYCSLLDFNVVGGASKIFAHFQKYWNPSSIISYADRSFNTGGLYDILGFQLSHFSAPAYYYTKDYKLIESRVKYQKHKLLTLPVYDSTLSEWEIMQLNGYDRIWDCGNSVWVWHNA